MGARQFGFSKKQQGFSEKKIIQIIQQSNNQKEQKSDPVNYTNAKRKSIIFPFGLGEGNVRAIGEVHLYFLP